MSVVSTVLETEPVKKEISFTPLHLVERLGKHHGSGEYRVRIHAEIFSGATETEALGKAMASILGSGQTIQVRLIT